MKILVVEDEGIIANNLADSLRRTGYEIIGIAPSGEDALEKVSRLKPDLVLMDVHLNGKIDGIETAERVRSEFSIPVIFLTAHANQEVLDRAKKTYPFGYLVKPIRQVDLVSTIEVAAYKHEVERKLKQREAWLATALRCTGDGVIVTDASGRVEFLNDLSKRILNIHAREVIGQKLCDLVCLRSRFTGAPAGDLAQLAILQGTTMSIGSDLILVDASSQETDIEGEVALCETDGSIVGTVFTFRDVTLRNCQDDQRRQDIGMRACARLAGAVSAELRTLLDPSVERLLQSDSDPGKRKAAIGKQTGSISRLADHLDVVMRRNASFPCQLNLNAFVSEACSELLPGVPRNIKLTSRLQPGLGRIYADPSQIKQAITSLILYSQDSMPDGGTIHFVTGSCDFGRRGRTGETESYVRLTISNMGPGIKTDEAQRLFEPFSGGIHQLDLKLFVAHEIISGAGGSIRAKSIPSQGLSFEILLPQRVDKEPGNAPTAAVANLQLEGAAILLLHSDHTIRSLVSERLEREGYEALEAADAGEALDWMTLHPGSIALLIANLERGDMGGPALAEQIAAQHPDISVVFTADHAVDPELRKVWIDHGARFLDQPFRLEELLRNVSEMLADGYPVESAAARFSRDPVRPLPAIC
jgi:CheY-like chemotaxis protein